MSKKQNAVRAFLEMRDGSFCKVENILQSPQLQRECKEKAELQRIISSLRKQGLLDEYTVQ